MILGAPEPRLGEFEGWKAIRVRRSWEKDPFAGAHFASATYGKESTAICLKSPASRCSDRDGPARVFNCRCGFYAMREAQNWQTGQAFRRATEWEDGQIVGSTPLTFLEDFADPRSFDVCAERVGPTVSALAQVSLWGNVLEATAGYRGQFQRINELWTFDIPAVHQSLAGSKHEVPIGDLTQLQERWKGTVWTSE